MFVNPLYDSSITDSIRTWTSGLIDDNETNRWTVRQQIVGYFSKVWSSNIEVNVYTTNDAYETVASTDATQRVFRVRIMRAHSQVSFSSASIIKPSTTTSTITIGTAYT